MTNLTLVPATVGSRRTWEKRLSTWRGLWNDFSEHPASRMSPAAPEYDPAQADQDAAGDLCSAAERLLMLTPAPDAGALLEKLDIWWKAQGPHRDDAEDTFAAIRGDVERLAKESGG